MAPHVHTHYYDDGEPGVAVAQSSPVVPNYAAYPQSCIPNPEAHFPNQASPCVRVLAAAHRAQARSYGQIPPGQHWARPMPDEVPTKYRRTSIQHEHPRRASQSFDAGHGAGHAPGYGDQGYAPAQFHQAPAPVQAYAPPAYQNYQHVQSPVQHVHRPDPHPYRPGSQYHTESPQYRTESPQYRTESPHYHPAQPQYQNAAPNQSYGLYAPHEHAGHQQAAQASFVDPGDLLLNTPYDFEAPGELEVPVPAPARQDYSTVEHGHQQFDQGYQHAEQAQFHPSPNYHHHVVTQMNSNVVAPQMHTTVAPSQMHTTVAPSQTYTNAVAQPHTSANIVTQRHSNVIAQGYVHPNVRRASVFEAPHEQVSFQVAHHDAFVQSHQHGQAQNQLVYPQGHQHVQPQPVQNHQLVQTHAHHPAPQPAQTMHHPGLGAMNPLQYPATTAQTLAYATTQVQTYSTDAETDVESDTDSQPTPGEPEQTPQRLEAIGYQRDLEDQFRKRARRFGDNVGSAFRRRLLAQGGLQVQGELSESEEDESDDESQASDLDQVQAPVLAHQHHYHQHHQVPAQPQPPARAQPIVPSQAHERTAPPSSSAQVDKKEVPTAPKKPALACLFCRKRKIACGPPPPDSPDRTCNQCMRRKQECVYPSESRRGIRKAPKETTAPVEDQPTVHTFVHDDGSGSSAGESSKAKPRRKRGHELID